MPPRTSDSSQPHRPRSSLLGISPPRAGQPRETLIRGALFWMFLVLASASLLVQGAWVSRLVGLFDLCFAIPLLVRTIVLLSRERSAGEDRIIAPVHAMTREEIG